LIVASLVLLPSFLPKRLKKFHLKQVEAIRARAQALPAINLILGYAHSGLGLVLLFSALPT